MTQEQIEQIIANMSQEELQQIENIQFPEEVVKQANADMASMDLANALVGYGMYRADLEVAELEAEEAGGELSKEASADFAEAGQELEEAIDASIAELGIEEIEDEAELHKEAQAAAGLIFSGYAAQLEKIAATKPAIVGKIVKKFKAGKAKAMAAGKEAVKHVKKHKGAIGTGAAIGGAAGAGYAVGKMQKKASEMTLGEIKEEILADFATEAVIAEGLEKSAAMGKMVAGKLKGALKAGKDAGKAAGKHLKKHKGKYIGGLTGSAAGYAIGKKLEKKD